jgi:hypothetical protein
MMIVGFEASLKKYMLLLLVIAVSIAGYGVFTTKSFQKGEFILDYAGVLTDFEEAFRKKDQTYIYYFRSGCKKYRCVITNHFLPL